MTTGIKFLSCLLIGGFLAVVIFTIGVGLQSKPNSNPQLSKVFRWNVHLFASFAGDGPELGRDASGEMMHEGSVVIVFFVIVGILSGLVIYPLCVFFLMVFVPRFIGFCKGKSAAEGELF